jgi:hypothetical protein
VPASYRAAPYKWSPSASRCALSGFGYRPKLYLTGSSCIVACDTRRCRFLLLACYVFRSTLVTVVVGSVMYIGRCTAWALAYKQQ